MTRTFTLHLVVVAALVMYGCGKSESPAPQAAVPDGATAAPVDVSATATPEEELAADVAKARELLVNYGGDGADLAAAKDLLKSVLKRDRDYAPAYVELARLEYKAGYISGDSYERTRLINAEKFLSHAFSLESDLPVGHLVRARTRLKLGEYDLAEESLASAEAAGVEKEELDAIRARVAAAYNDVPGAMRIARSVIDSEASSPALKIEMLSFIAPQLEYEGFREEAQKAWEQCVELDPDDAWGHGNLAAFYLDHGDLEKGLKHAERAVEIMPYPIGVRTMARAYIMRAEELYNERRYDEAGRLIEKLGEKVEKDNPDIDELLGNYYYGIFVRTSDKSYLDRAIVKYRAVLATDPERSEVARTLRRAEQRRDELAK